MIEYWDRYQSETLASLNPTVIYQELLAFGQPDVALCCYESTDAFCHRHCLAHWLTQNTGVVVREYGNHPIIFGG